MVPAPMMTEQEADRIATEVRAAWDALSEDERRALLYAKLGANPPADMQLAHAYVEYVVTVSPDWMAMSLPSALFLSGLCAQRRPLVLADFGSGFSSYVLRRYASRTGARVVSVDDSPEWLERTREFLERYRLDTNDLVTWDAWVAGEYPPMDLAFHDFASGELREASMSIVADRMRTGGVIVFDDANHAGHRAAMSAVARSHGWMLACLPQTLDGNQRYEALVECRTTSAS